MVPAPAATPMQTYATGTLVERGAVRQLVDQLAAQKLIAGDSVSDDGHEPPEYRLYLRLIGVATKDEMLALTQHESPIVRGYAARYVVEHAFSTAHLELLLADATMVTTFEGCSQDTEPMSWVVVQALCDHRDAPGPRASLQQIAAGRSVGHAHDAVPAQRAQQCLSSL